VIAANLDLLGIAIAGRPAAPGGYVDSAIVAARAAGIEPVLVVNKCDQSDSRELYCRMRDEYAGSGGAPGIAVLAVSALDGRGQGELRALLAPDRRAAFVGTSGVGKSSLLNALVPGLDLAVGEFNRFTRLGRHVTTRSSLHTLCSGGELIDTPGVRDFQPVSLPTAELARHFAGFEPGLARGCRFRNCLHRDEPECGIALEIASGRIAPARHQAYLRILEALEQAERAARRR
jgi:ribosome biogenesis GTPase